MRLKAFQALVPPVRLARRVASVPYDTLNTEEARVLAKGNPVSFLRVSRPELELPKGTDPYSDAVYARAARNFAALQKQGALVREKVSHLYVYRQIMGRHAQSGIVGCCHIDDYEKNVILKHEKTRKDKEDDRCRHVRTLRCHNGPVFLTYKDSRKIDRRVSAAQKQKPLFDFTAVDGIRHTVWRLPAAKEVIALVESQVPVSYIADGHHRAAASYRVGSELRAANPQHTGEEEYNWFLAVLFPGSQLQIMPYNRLVKDLNGLSESAFLEAVQKAGFTVKVGAPASPKGGRKASMYLGGRWYGLTWKVPAGTDAVSALDVSVLQSWLLDPILGIRDPRTDQRIEFVGGIRGPGELVKKVDSGAAAVAFSLFPVEVKQVMAVADAGMMMPPKSTWFEPKLRSGLLLHTF